MATLCERFSIIGADAIARRYSGDFEGGSGSEEVAGCHGSEIRKIMGREGVDMSRYKYRVGSMFRFAEEAFDHHHYRTIKDTSWT